MSTNDQGEIDTTINSFEEVEIDLDKEIANIGDDDEVITIPKKTWDTLNAQKDHFKNKARPATTVTPLAKPAEKKVDETGLSQSDFIAIARADIHDDDIESVKRFAKMEGLTISESLKNDDMRAILDRREGVRKTADATNTNTSRRSAPKADADTILKNVSEGKIPDAGSRDADELFWARRGGRR